MLKSASNEQIKRAYRKLAFMRDPSALSWDIKERISNNGVERMTNNIKGTTT